MKAISSLLIAAFYMLFCDRLWANELISTSVGLVNQETMTSRDVYARFLIDTALSDPAQFKKLSFRLPAVESPRFGELLNQNLTEWMVYLESLNFPSIQVSSDLVDQKLNQAIKILESVPAWKTLKVERSEGQIILKKYLQANRFIQYRSSSAQVPVSAEEALKYYEENQSRFGALPFADFEESIKAVLIQRQREKRLKDWVSMLQNKYSARNLLAEQ